MSEQPPHPMRLTTKLVVKFWPGGVQMVHGTATGMSLKFHDLLAISELHANEHIDAGEVAAIVAKRASVDQQVVRQFINSLTKTGRLRRRKNAVPSVELPPAAVSVAPQASLPLTSLMALKIPLSLRLYCGEYQLIDHDGGLLISLNSAEVLATSTFTSPIDFDAGFKLQSELLGTAAVDESRLKEILSLLWRARLVTAVEFNTLEGEATPDRGTRIQAKKARFAQHAAQQEQAEKQREERTGVVRPKVIPVSLDESVPAALGLMIAYAKTYADSSLDDVYDFRLDWFWDDDRLADYASKPAIYLFSNYLWTHPQSIATSEKIKQHTPDSITIHGGPDTPKYTEDAQRYFESNPHVDIIIRGEGEASCAETLDKLSIVIGQKNPDLSVLNGVAGISYQYKGEVFRNPDRDRIADVDTIPSPYLAGLFDAFKDIPCMHVTLETNRGCPYGCTFCDWGSATSSKIRKFDLERVYGELQWCSDAKMQSVSVADANFGVFARDVDIAQKVGDLKRETGYPEAFGGSFAKNSTKYLQKIIRIMADADIWSQGVLSLQTMDAETLSAINRSNIKVEKYDALANEMRSANLQLSVELMMALPGSTLLSFIEDLQQCIDRDIQARINHTTLLVNSPMNAPEYLEKHQIKTGKALVPGETPYLESTSTFSKEDLSKMLVIRDAYILLDNFAVLRLCSRFVRQQTGTPEMDFILKLLADVGNEPDEKNWPILNTLVNSGGHLMAAPYSWALMIDELRRYLVNNLGLPDDSALDTIMLAQHALLPAFGRVYPLSLELPHDVVAWHEQMLTAKAAGHGRDWHTVVPRLSEFGPGRIEVNDSDGFVTSMLGCEISTSGMGINWDMESGIGRARVSQEFEPAWMPQKAEVIHVS